MSAAPRPLAGPARSRSSPVLGARASSRSLAVDVALLGPVMLLALAARLVNLGAYSGLFDEGIRTEQLYLMSLGYRPFKDIFAAQGPLLLDAMYPLYALFRVAVDQPLVAVRLVPVSYSLVGLAGLYWLGCQLSGRLGGLVASLLLALSPLYLEGSRLALAEVPALAPAIVALGCALRYQQGGQMRWLAAAGLLLTLSLLMKPITLAAAPAVGLAAMLRGRRGLRDLVAAAIAMLGLAVLIVWLLGFNEFTDQILSYRQASREAAGWSLRKNFQALQVGLGFEPSALLPLAALGGLVLIASGWRTSLPAVAWVLGCLVLLLGYSPLHGKHIVVLVPAAALLAGAGLARTWQLSSGLASARRSTVGRLIVAGPIALAVLWYVGGLVPLLAHTGQLLRVTADTDVDPAFDQYGDAVHALLALTGPDDFIVTDQPYLAFLASRKVPPELVDTALARIRSRSLTGARAQTLAAAYNPKVVLLWGDRLRSLAAFKSWVESSYQVVKVYNRRGDTDRALYLRRDSDFGAARVLLAQRAAAGPSAQFGGDLRLAGAYLESSEIASGQGSAVTMLWELLHPTPIDYHALVSLRAADGRSVDEQQESLSGGSAGTSQWLPGHWLVQTSFVLTADLPAGQYSVHVALYDSRARATIPIADRAAARDLMVGSLTVR